MVFLLLILYLNSVTSVFLHHPSNMARLKGDNMTMTCDPNVKTNSINWYHSPVRNINTTPPVLPVNKGASVNKDFSEFSLGGSPSGQFLFLNYTQLKHAGLYKCASKGETATAELIVLESEPNCSMTAYAVSGPTQFRLVCSVVYNGNLAPVMEWQQQQPHGDGLHNIALYNELINERDDKRVTSSLIITSNYSMHPFQYSCKTYFSNSSFKHAAATSATNMPLYQYNWMSPTIHIIPEVNSVNVVTADFVTHDSTRVKSKSSTLGSGGVSENGLNMVKIVSLSAAVFIMIIIASFLFIYCGAKRNHLRQADFRKDIQSSRDEKNAAIRVDAPVDEIGTVQTVIGDFGIPSNYEEIEVDVTSGQPSCLHPTEGKGVSTDDRSSVSTSTSSSPSVKSKSRYQNLTSERAPVQPSVYLRLLSRNKEQETQTSDHHSSSSSSVVTHPDSADYVNSTQVQPTA